jgi:hypothetical protein
MSDWVYITGGREHAPTKVDGFEVWAHEWTRDPGDAVVVRDPRYGQEFRFPVYTITDGGRTTMFAAGEFSNGSWGFFQPLSDAVEHMALDEEHIAFISLCSALVDEVSAAIENNPEPADYPNAKLLLGNLTAWRQLAWERRLFHPSRPDFGVSKSDLLFGRAGERVRELEDFYHHQIYRRRVGR